MIETKKALDNLKEILRIDGLDAVYVGPADLSNALGCTPKFDQDEKPVGRGNRSYRRRDDRAPARSPASITAPPAYAKKMIEKGFRFVTIASDARLLAAGAKAVVTEMKGAEKTTTSVASRTY